MYVERSESNINIAILSLNIEEKSEEDMMMIKKETYDNQKINLQSIARSSLL